MFKFFVIIVLVYCNTIEGYNAGRDRNNAIQTLEREYIASPTKLRMPRQIGVYPNGNYNARPFANQHHGPGFPNGFGQRGFGQHGFGQQGFGQQGFEQRGHGPGRPYMNNGPEGFPNRPNHPCCGHGRGHGHGYGNGYGHSHGHGHGHSHGHGHGHGRNRNHNHHKNSHSEFSNESDYDCNDSEENNSASSERTTRQPPRTSNTPRVTKRPAITTTTTEIPLIDIRIGGDE